MKKYNNFRTYRGYDIVKDETKSSGEFGLWYPRIIL